MKCFCGTFQYTLYMERSTTYFCGTFQYKIYVERSMKCFCGTFQYKIYMEQFMKYFCGTFQYKICGTVHYMFLSNVDLHICGESCMKKANYIVNMWNFPF
jgi:hypothetical protein